MLGFNRELEIVVGGADLNREYMIGMGSFGFPREKCLTKILVEKKLLYKI